jgi:hypothetical protein
MHYKKGDKISFCCYMYCSFTGQLKYFNNLIDKEYNSKNIFGSVGQLNNGAIE